LVVTVEVVLDTAALLTADALVALTTPSGMQIAATAAAADMIKRFIKTPISRAASSQLRMTPLACLTVAHANERASKEDQRNKVRAHHWLLRTSQ